MTNEMLIQELNNLNKDSIQIVNCIADLQNKIEEFKKTYQSQHLLGEQIKPGLDDSQIRQIEEQVNLLAQMQDFFDFFSPWSEGMIDILIDSAEPYFNEKPY